MTLQPSWTPRPAALDVWTKYGILNGISPLDNVLAAGALSPDVQPNSPPSFALPQPNSPTSPSLLKIGDYVLTERLSDAAPGIAVWKTIHATTREEFVCRILPLDRCRASLTPFSTVGPHPNINGVNEVMVGTTSAYVMQRIGADCAEDLHAYVRRNRRLSEAEAARLFRQTLEAVAHCHRNGVVVRDIKLRRFMFADAEKSLLQLDGLYDSFIFTGNDDRLSEKHGCLAYVSPEILDATFMGVTSPATSETTFVRIPQGSPAGLYAGRAADMWGLGIMLYTMLVGRYPFADTDASTLFARIRRGRYPMPAEISLSAAARCLIRSLLTANPTVRVTAEEALRHPWFAQAAMETLSPAFPCSGVDDRAVPDVAMETADDFSVE